MGIKEGREREKKKIKEEEGGRERENLVPRFVRKIAHGE